MRAEAACINTDAHLSPSWKNIEKHWSAAGFSRAVMPAHTVGRGGGVLLGEVMLGEGREGEGTYC